MTRITRINYDDGRIIEIDPSLDPNTIRAGTVAAALAFIALDQALVPTPGSAVDKLARQNGSSPALEARRENRVMAPSRNDTRELKQMLMQDRRGGRLASKLNAGQLNAVRFALRNHDQRLSAVQLGVLERVFNETESYTTARIAKELGLHDQSAVSKVLRAGLAQIGIYPKKRRRATN